MARTFPRNNITNILGDPLLVTALSSIALHALFAAYLLPYLTKPEPAGKRTEPNTVKVVELTPTEVQRIPRAPEPQPTPTPAQPALPPVYQPSQPVAPTAPKVTTSPVIPTTPVRKPSPKAKTTPKTVGTPPIVAPTPSKGGIFDPSAFDPKPSPKPTKTPAPKTPAKKVTRPKPSPTPTVKPSVKPAPPKQQQPATKTPIPVAPKPTVGANTDDDGGEQGSPTPQSTPPANTGQPQAKPTVTPTNSRSGAGGAAGSSAPSANESGGGSFYGKYAQVAIQRLRKYQQDNPGIKTYQPQLLSQNYPAGVPCRKVKQPPFIVLMVAFGKVPQGQNSEILGETTAPSIDRPYVAGDSDTPDNRKLAQVAADAALYAANKADQNRAEADKDKPVLYQYRVQFDPNSCKN